MRRPVAFADDHLFEPLDGGWGWVVVFSSGVLGLTNRAITNVFGLLFGGALKAMGHETTAAAVIANVMNVVCNLAGLFIGPAVRHYDYRRVAIAGVLLASAGISLTFLATRIWHMVITYSLMFGLGVGLQMTVRFLAVNTYWRRWRGRAFGLALACSNVGHMLLPYLVAYLLENYGFRGAMLLLGPLCLQGLPAVLLWQPLGWHSKRKVQTRGEELRCLRMPDVENGTEDEKAAVNALTLVSGMPWMLFVTAMEGFTRGATLVNYFISVADAVPSTKTAGAVGLLTFLGGLTALILGPIIGHIRDSTGDYALCVRLIAIIKLLAMAGWLLEFAVTAARRRLQTSPRE